MFLGFLFQQVLIAISLFLLQYVFINLPVGSKLVHLQRKTIVWVMLLLFLIVIANIRGLKYGYSYDRIYTDNFRFYSFIILICTPLVVLRFKRNVYNFFVLGNKILILIVSIFVLINLSVFGNVAKSILPANLFTPSTVILTLVSNWTIYNLYLFFVKQHNYFLYQVSLCWVVTLITLQKWNIFVIAILPIAAIYFLIRYQSKKYRLYYSLLFFAILFFIAISLNKIASLSGFNDINDFIENKITMGMNDSSGENIVENLNLGTETAIRDGSRLLMWDDLITRGIKKIWFGLGFGVRALDYVGWDMEDHNIFVEFFSRFGLPAFLINLFFGINYFKSLVQKGANEKKPFLKYIFLIAILNFFFQSFVGNVWGMLVVDFLIGLAWGICIRESEKLTNA